MSMISNQCDELHNLALWLDDEFYDAEASKVRQAADTIWELRRKLSGVVDQRDEIERLRVENAKLRDDWESERDYADQMEVKEKKAVAENNMLREMLSESRQTNEHIFTELKRYKSVMRTRPIAMNALFDENTKLRELLKNALTYIEYEGCGVECPDTGHGATLTPCDTCNRYETESCAYVIAQSALEIGLEVE